MNERSIVKKYFFATLILSFMYAFIRYFILKEVPTSRIPLWITNKATSLASVILICISVLWRSDKPRKQLGLLGAFLGFLHAIISAAILNPTYYSKFFQADNSLTLLHELSILFGVLTLAFLLVAAFYSFPTLYDSTVVELKTINRYVTLALTAVLAHLIFMSFKGWLNISHWPSYLPPVSLIAALFCLYTLRKKIIKSVSK